jgi:tau tubulin kinase
MESAPHKVPTETTMTPNGSAASIVASNPSFSEGGAVELDGGYRSRHLTPVNSTAPDATSERRRRSTAGAPAQQHAVYGRVSHVSTSGSFPNAGSQLGPYFLFQEIGKGTFSSIHKCVNMEHFHTKAGAAAEVPRLAKPRVAVAKVELRNFVQSGVLEAEATILHYLSRTLLPGTVPRYLGHYKSGPYAAIVMEYLPGQDMHHLREKVMTGSQSRRVTVPDAVYLAADVMLPLLQRMHEAGVVHRDVKPSNCVRSTGERDFCIVDFGLSKSIVVPEDSPLADKDHTWPHSQWLQPCNHQGAGFYRLEREKAEFRGTSMYASLRVHQGKDYAPRDDVWSLLYVFCDLVSGGLPWMSHAANRDRPMCQTLKERIHGDAGDGADQTEQLLMGDEYHVMKFRREKQEAAGEQKLINLPTPLSLSQDEKKVDCLRRAFRHVGQLGFTDQPDYAYVRDCIHGFLEDPTNHPPARPIEWKTFPSTSPIREPMKGFESNAAHGDTADQSDPLDMDLFRAIENSTNLEMLADETVGEMDRLPLEWRFRFAQIQYDVDHARDVSVHLVLRDWLMAAQTLLYDDWDAKRFEDGGHRTATDGFRRQKYVVCLTKCQEWAHAFDNFQKRECFFEVEHEIGMPSSHPLSKKRKFLTGDRLDLLAVSKAIFGIKAALDSEKEKRTAPPVRISFGAN